VKMEEACVGLRATEADFALRTTFVGWNPATAGKQRMPPCEYLFARPTPVVAENSLNGSLSFSKAWRILGVLWRYALSILNFSNTFLT
jgi:hypothetical protein